MQSETRGVRLLVTGGREYDNWRVVSRTLNAIDADRRIVLVIHGAAKGADALAREWAVQHNVPHLPFPVSPDEWRTIGPRAGPLRNQRMVDEGKPDAYVAFPGGRGTADCIARCKLARIPFATPSTPAPDEKTRTET